MKSANWKINSGILVAYILITTIITYPAIKGLIDAYTVPGAGIDSRYFLWHLWWVKYALLNLGTSPTFTRFIFYPSGGVLFLASPFNELTALTLQPLLGLTRAYSFIWFLSFPMAGFTTYLLGYYFTGNRWAGFVGGLIFAFSAHHYAQAIMFMGLWTIQWLPLYVLALFLFLKRPTIKTAVLVTISFVLAIISEHVYYLFYFVIPVTGLFLVYHWFTSPQQIRKAQFWVAFILAIIVGALLVSPVYLHILQNRNEDFVKATGVVIFSADAMAYLTPARNHPLWHNLVDPLYKKFTGIEIDQTIFIGFMAMILALIGGILGAKNQRGTIRFWIWLGILAFIFSLGPLLHIVGPVKVPVEDIEMYISLPYLFLVNLPFIGVLRAPARLSVTVQLAVAILAVYGMVTLTRYWPRLQHTGTYLVLAVLVLFESVYLVPYRVDSTSLDPPPIYRQIAQEKNDLAVLEIPSRQESVRFFVFYFMYYATIHQHPLVGGETARIPPELYTFLDTSPFIRELMHPSQEVVDEPDVVATSYEDFVKLGAQLLARHHIGYVILHRDIITEGFDDSGQLIPELMLKQALGNPFYDDGKIVGYRVPQNKAQSLPAQETLILGDGWEPKSAPFNGQPVRWARPTNSLIVYEPGSTKARLSITAFAPMSNYITVTMSVNGTSIETFQVAPTPNTPETHLTRPFPLIKGANEIRFEVQPAGIPEQQLDPQVYLGVYDISLNPTLDINDVAPKHLQQVNLGGQVEFIGYDQNTESIQRGDTLHLTLYWHPLAQMDQSYKVFIHLLDNQGNTLAQYDAIPQNWLLPTTAWGNGEVVPDEYHIPIPPDISPGTYFINLGLYNEATGERLTVPGNEENVISIQPIEVIK